MKKTKQQNKDCDADALSKAFNTGRDYKPPSIYGKAEKIESLKPFPETTAKQVIKFYEKRPKGLNKFTQDLIFGMNEKDNFAIVAIFKPKQERGKKGKRI